MMTILWVTTLSLLPIVYDQIVACNWTLYESICFCFRYNLNYVRIRRGFCVTFQFPQLLQKLEWSTTANGHKSRLLSRVYLLLAQRSLQTQSHLHIRIPRHLFSSLITIRKLYWLRFLREKFWPKFTHLWKYRLIPGGNDEWHGHRN